MFASKQGGHINTSTSQVTAKFKADRCLSGSVTCAKPPDSQLKNFASFHREVSLSTHSVQIFQQPGRPLLEIHSSFANMAILVPRVSLLEKRNLFWMLSHTDDCILNFCAFEWLTCVSAWHQTRSVCLWMRLNLSHDAHSASLEANAQSSLASDSAPVTASGNNCHISMLIAIAASIRTPRWSCQTH